MKEKKKVYSIRMEPSLYEKSKKLNKSLSKLVRELIVEKYDSIREDK